MDLINNYLVLKLGNSFKDDFYEEHSKIIEKYGYVDFFIAYKKNPAFDKYNKSVVIKEGSKQGNRLFMAEVVERLDNGQHFPKYYDAINKENGLWVRIKGLKEIDRQYLLDNFETKTGKSIDSIFRASVPYFGLRKK